MDQKPTQEELERKIRDLQKEVKKLEQEKALQQGEEKIHLSVEPSTRLTFSKKPKRNLAPPKKQLHGRALKLKLLGTMQNLPAMPQVITKAQRIMADPNSSLKDLANIAKTDQAIVAKALRMANSAYYGLRGKVSSIEHFSVMLGHKGFGELVTMSAASKLLGGRLKGYGVDAGALWRHSLVVAFGARIIANRTVPDLANDAFTAGIIHDVGKLILDQSIFERKDEFEDLFREGQRTLVEAEKEILGFDHAEMASDMCKRWRFPPSLAIPIKFHHSPSLSGGNQLAYTLNIADSMALMSDVEVDVDDMLDRLDDTAAGFLGLQYEDVSDIMTEIIRSVEEVEEGLI